MTTTLLFSAATAPVGHQLGWADLSPWAGQAVTLTFQLAPTDFDDETELYLDQISLASWLTPLVEAIAPDALEPGVAVPITITGQNFLVGGSVALTRGGQTIPGVAVQRLDAQTLRLDLPALGPGIYDLRVTNPGGQQSMRIGAVQVGQQNYIPFLAR